MQNQLANKIRYSEQPIHGEAEIIERVKTSLIKRGMETTVAKVAAGKLRNENEESSPEPQCNDVERGSGSEHEKEKVPMKGYVISFSRKRKLRRLHYLGRCHRRPGQDYREWTYLGEEPPNPERYDVKCLQCWRAKLPNLKPTNSSSASDATTSSSTDSD